MTTTRIRDLEKELKILKAKLVILEHSFREQLAEARYWRDKCNGN